jgi:hypothetical protein
MQYSSMHFSGPGRISSSRRGAGTEIMSKVFKMADNNIVTF